jgi:hypothetical protein
MVAPLADDTLCASFGFYVSLFQEGFEGQH